MLMFTCKSIVVNMHKCVMFFRVLCFHCKCNLRHKMKVKETKVLLRQRFNDKIGYTLCSKTHLV